METTHFQTISQILESIVISNSEQVIFQGRLIFEANNLLESRNITQKGVIDIIQKTIYNHYYIQKHNSFTNNIDSENFLCSLKKTTSSKPFWHRRWQIEYVHSNGNVIARNKFRRLLVQSGGFIHHKPQGVPSQVGDLISICQLQQYFAYDGGFFHIYGKALDEQFYEAIIRFYFNILPEIAIELIDFLAFHLNRLRIPFHFKCLSNPKLYERADVAVLYVDKKYFFGVIPLLRRFLSENSSFFCHQIPLFTYQVANGIGFAENPPDPTESFGMSRCRLIAEGIWESYQQKIDSSHRVDFIVSYIQKQGYSLERFYLNPNSRFPYNFE